MNENSTEQLSRTFLVRCSREQLIALGDWMYEQGIFFQKCSDTIHTLARNEANSGTDDAGDKHLTVSPTDIKNASAWIANAFALRWLDRVALGHVSDNNLTAALIDAAATLSKSDSVRHQDQARRCRLLLRKIESNHEQSDK